MPNRLKLFQLIFFSLFVLLYFASLNYMILYGKRGGTLGLHAVYAERMMNGEELKEGLENLPHVAYFYSVIALHRIGLDFRDAAIVVLSIGHLLAFLFTYGIYRYFLPKSKSNLLLLFAAFVSIMAFSLYLPFINENIYFGQGSPNTHHNSTIILLKPFATLTFFVLVHEFQSPQRNLKKLFFGAILLVLGILAKPTFALVFLPALGLYLLFRPNRIQNIAWLIVISLPSVLVLGLEYLNYYELAEHNRQIGFGLFTVWQIHSANILLSIFQALAFPIFPTLFRWNQFKYPSFMLISWLMVFIGLIQFSILLETDNGIVLNTANWIGGYLMGQSLLYTVTILEALFWIFEHPNLKSSQKILLYLAIFVLIVQFFTGFYYDYTLVRASDFRFPW